MWKARGALRGSEVAAVKIRRGVSEVFVRTGNFSMKSLLRSFNTWFTHRRIGMHFVFYILFSVYLTSHQVTAAGILYPKASETRETLSLDGLWNFAVPSQYERLLGYNERWYRSDLDKVESVKSMLMPVPSSYNDITQSASIRDHVGVVWYDRKFFVPKSWANSTRVWIRFSSVSYSSQVWINGELAMGHEIGHLPFQEEITHLLHYGAENKVTVACDNTLLQDSVPQGQVVEVNSDNGKKLLQTYTFDFFNYAGIHRPVTLFTTPNSYIDDITVTTDVDNESHDGIVRYNVSFYAEEPLAVNVTLIDKHGKVAARDDGFGYADGVLLVPQAKLWWPYLMHNDPGYMYTLEVSLITEDGQLVDIYRQPVGIRKLTWSNTGIYMNDKPIYFHGFGRHEDSDIRGKGLDLPTTLRDYELIKWIGGNVYRTSHYPYADEIMDLADQMGIMIIDECPSVNTEIFSQPLLKKHKQSLTELIRRDKNRPSVVAWSIANEPRTQTVASGEYFGKVANHTRILDSTRPITIAIARGVSEDKAGVHLDFISFNRYNAWYNNGGQLDMIIENVINEATGWHDKYNKPVLMAEYGGDTMIGLHLSPEYIWSEEYQTTLLSRHFEAFDKLRAKGWFIGEFIWNFADFNTGQTYTRVGGNRKGLFTRNRQPKQAAYLVRKRYHHLSNELYNSSLPNDLYHYVSVPTESHYHNEL